MPRLRSTPEDFVVDEQPLYPPSGTGDHLWVHVEKRRLTTEEVASLLAAAAGVDVGQVGWAGRKDRDAVTRQWLSVPGLSADRARALGHPEDARGSSWSVLAAAPHHERLRLGELVANRFRLVVREVDAAAAATATARLADIGRHGMPNRFGGQRFGRDGDNADRGAQLLREAMMGPGGSASGKDPAGLPPQRGPARPQVGRRQQRLWLSAVQSAVFNEVLAERPAPPHQLLPGDLALVHTTGALLTVADDDTALAARAERLEVSATGPLFGHKMRTPRGESLRREKAVLERRGLPWVAALPRLSHHLLPGGRRPLRALVGEVSSRYADGAFELAFTLPPGSYATVLVEELFPGGVDEGPPGSLPSQG